MERRKALKNIGLSFGAFIATPTVLSLLQSCGPSMEPWAPAYLTEDQGKLLRKLIDGILPAVDDLPSASDVNVHVIIDNYLNVVMPLEERDATMGFFEKVREDILKSAGASDVEDLTAEQVDEYLNQNLKKTEEELEAMWSEVVKIDLGEAETTEGAEAIQQDMFLIKLRDMTIASYKRNEIVGKNILAYDPVPGGYIGCGDLQELTGGRIWAE